jgi:dTDP-4-dehydrorhamnose reductase
MPAAQARALGVPFIQMSTDYVFDGALTRPYTEEDPPNPLNAYGRSKLDGEMRARSACPWAIVLRTSWVFGPYGSNFLRSMLRLAATENVIRVVDDQCGTPTAAADLADAILAILGSLRGKPDHAGVYHLTASGHTTWHGFAAAILARLPAGWRAPKLVAISSSEYPSLARRPPNSRLDCTKVERRFGIRLPEWEQALDLCLEQLAEFGRC